VDHHLMVLLEGQGLLWLGGWVDQPLHMAPLLDQPLHMAPLLGQHLHMDPLPGQPLNMDQLPDQPLHMDPLPDQPLHMDQLLEQGGQLLIHLHILVPGKRSLVKSHCWRLCLF